MAYDYQHQQHPNFFKSVYFVCNFPSVYANFQAIVFCLYALFQISHRQTVQWKR